MGKRFKNGLVLGKYMPCTLGHMYLIDTAIKHSENVYVMICSLKSEPIPGDERYYWLTLIYHNQPNVHIIHCKDENPQHTWEAESVDSFYNDFWIKSVYSRIKELDVVFTSEDYGDEFARYLGIKHFLVDKERKKYPVSGTAVRSNPFGNWNFLHKIVKSYFMKKVVIMGPESTGKSTLIKNLSKHFGFRSIEEYGRTYTEQTGTTNLELKDFENIAKGHKHNIDIECASKPDKLVFVDTEALTTKIFGEMYLGFCESDIIDKIISEQKFDLYLVLGVDVPWVDDGTRDFPNKREWHLNRITSELEARGISYTLITGNYEERLQKAIKAVEPLLLG